MKVIENKTFDEERALYHSENLIINNIKVTGPKDGESVLKESKNIIVNNSLFDLRYPFWHVNKLELNGSELTENCRAGIWYSDDIKIKDTTVNGVKVIRECSDIVVDNCKINSPEPFWYCTFVTLNQGLLSGDYAFLNSKNININNLNFSGKYSFQYVENLQIEDSYLDTKDAFWGSKNITVRNSTIKGAYLAWYSENLRLVDCKIIGTQPLCYCKNLVLENCEMIDCDLSFEYSDVKATVKGEIMSVKNPKSGYIKAGRIGEIIIDQYAIDGDKCHIETDK